MHIQKISYKIFLFIIIWFTGYVLAAVVNSSDSAFFVLPRHKSLLNDSPVKISIKPLCKQEIDSVYILVSHFPNITDTLGRIKNEPYDVLWFNDTLQDQDQIYLQFGYVIFGKKDLIISKPMPHHWAIARNIKKSNKKVYVMEIDSQKVIELDGYDNDWKKIRWINIDKNVRFKTAWNAYYFFAFVKVYKKNITPYDRVEFCFALDNRNSVFLDIEHRIFSISPVSRSFCWAIDMSNEKEPLNDSLIIRFQEEVEWITKATDDYYTVEIKIPFGILGDYSFPPKKFGFDICVNEMDNGIIKKHIWSKADWSCSHMPALWGIAILRQRFFVLKLLFAISAIILFLLILLMVLRIIGETRDNIFSGKESKLSRKILEYLENNIHDKNLSVKKLEEVLVTSSQVIECEIKKYHGVDFDTFLNNIRLKKAKALANKYLSTQDKPDFNIIAHKCGFNDYNELANKFKKHFGESIEDWYSKQKEEFGLDDEE